MGCSASSSAHPRTQYILPPSSPGQRSSNGNNTLAALFHESITNPAWKLHIFVDFPCGTPPLTQMLLPLPAKICCFKHFKQLIERELCNLMSAAPPPWSSLIRNHGRVHIVDIHTSWEDGYYIVRRGGERWVQMSSRNMPYVLNSVRRGGEEGVLKVLVDVEPQDGRWRVRGVGGMRTVVYSEMY